METLAPGERPLQGAAAGACGRAPPARAGRSHGRAARRGCRAGPAGGGLLGRRPGPVRALRPGPGRASRARRRAPRPAPSGTAARGTAQPAGVPGALPAPVRAGPGSRPPLRAGPAHRGRAHPAVHLHRRGAPAQPLDRPAPPGRAVSPVPTHDAAGATLGGRTFVFGGGEQSSVATVQESRRGRRPPHGTATVAGRLPGPRSDLVAVTRGGTAYLLGGYDGAGYDATVLATRDGRHFTVAARLAVPVRYPAVAVLGSQIWVFGGQTSHGITNDIQRISLAGQARCAGAVRRGRPGRRSWPGTCRGRRPRRPRSRSAGRSTSRAGRPLRPARAGHGQPVRHADDQRRRAPLPAGPPGGPGRHAARSRWPTPAPGCWAAPRSWSAGTTGYAPVPTVTELRLVPPAAAIPSVTPGSTLDARLGPGSRRAAAPADLALSGEPWLSPPHGRGHLAPHSDPAALPGDILIADNHNNRLLVVDPQGRIRWQFPEPGDLARRQTFQVPDDAFFSPDGKDIIATEEDDSVISVINIATHRIVYRYGTPGVPGSVREPPVQPRRRDAAARRRHAVGRHQELPDHPGQAARAPASPDHRPDQQRLLARPAPAVRQPQRRLPDDQRQVPGHRDQRGLGERRQPVRPRLLVGQPAGRQLPV